MRSAGGLSPALSLSACNAQAGRPHLSSTWIGEGFGATFFACCGFKFATWTPLCIFL